MAGGREAADTASVRAAAKALQRKISNEKGQFTRRENKILSLKGKGDGNIANTALSELNKKAEIIFSTSFTS